MIVKTKILNVIKALFKEGMSLKKISLSIALGAVLGIFPVLGATTLLCTVAAFVLRLNLPSIQVVNYLVYPLQLVLLAPFYAAGSWLFNDGSLHMIEGNIIDLLKNDFWASIVSLWDLTLYAVVVWLIISPFVVLLLYGLLMPLVRSLASAWGYPSNLRT
jgi:uncharacterized protein (DUF2062 family)